MNRPNGYYTTSLDWYMKHQIPNNESYSWVRFYGIIWLNRRLWGVCLFIVQIKRWLDRRKGAAGAQE